MENKRSEERKKQRCRKCGSGQVYIRLKDKTVVCRICGNVDPMEDQDA